MNRTEKLRALQECFVCGQMYRELENIGHWKCREHPGTVKNGRFTCCGEWSGGAPTVMAFYQDGFREIESKGCIKADHRSVLITYSNGIHGKRDIPDSFIAHYKITPEKIEGESGNRVYYRYDRTALRRRGLPAKPRINQTI